MRHVLSAALPLLACLLAPATSAQLGRPNGVRIEVQALASVALSATYDGMVGCARDRDGNYWVTGRRAGTDPAHKLFLFSQSGAFVAAYDQPAETQASGWGLRDLAYDARDHVLYAGCETSVARRLFAFDIAARRFDPTRAVPLPATVSGTARGVAFDTRGANGAGTFLVSDFTTPVVEFDRGGTVRATWPSTNGAKYGLGVYDFFGPGSEPFDGRIEFCQSGGGNPSCKLEGRPIDFDGTEASFLCDPSIPGTAPGGLAGGGEVYLKNGVPTALILSQATSDVIYEVAADYDRMGTCTNAGVAGSAGGAAFAGNAAFRMTLKESAGQLGFFLIGMPGALPPIPNLLPCGLGLSPLVPPIVIGATPIVAGSGSVPLPIPAVASLRGAGVRGQWLVQAPTDGLIHIVVGSFEAYIAW